MRKFAIPLLTLGLITQAHAFKCFLTLVKEDCWTNYTVTINAMNARTGKAMVTAVAPQNETWGRQEFACEPGDILSFQAKFAPVFWDKDEGKVYSGQSYWTLPKTVQSGEEAWNIKICFANSFAGVPLPPDAKNNCQCDFKVVPPVETH